jgi:hypothetical protein
VCETVPWTRDIDGNLVKTEAMSDAELNSEIYRAANTIYNHSSIPPHHREHWQKRELAAAKRYLQDLQDTD